MKIFKWIKNVIPLEPSSSQETLTQLDDSELKYQQDLAEEFYTKNPELAMSIALGLEKAPEGILASAIYAKVCDVAEKSEDAETSMKVSNSFHNSKISAEAQELNFRSPHSAIEVMKDVVNARRKAFEKKLPEGKTLEKIIDEEVEIIKKEISKTKLTKKEMAEEMEDFIDSVKKHTQ